MTKPTSQASQSFSSPHQSEHSRRGSTTANSLVNSPRGSLPHSAGLSTSTASLPNFTLGARVRDHNSDISTQSQQTNLHPYDVILPGQEQYRNDPRPKSHAMTSVAHTTLGSPRSVSITNQTRPIPIGARRFTSTATSFIQRSGTISSTGTANQAAAVHARRFSTIAREPSIAVAARNSQAWSGGPSEVMHADNDLSEVKKSAKSDAKILLNSLSSLLGHDGGGEAVGRLVKYIFSGGLSNLKKDFSGLIKKVLLTVPALQAAYLTVHLHEILEQLQRLGGLIYAEPEVVTLFSDLGGNFVAFMSSLQSQAGGKSYLTMLCSILDKLTASTIYKSAFLTLLDRVCQFIVASEGVRDGLWTRLSESLFGSQGVAEQNEVQHIGEFMALFFASIEQLTGSPIKPLVKTFVGWIAVLDDLLTRLAKDTREFLARPSQVPPLNDYVAHPLGYVYSPSETNERLKVVLEMWSTQLFETSVHKECFDRFKKNLDNVIIGIQGNSTFARFSRDLRRVWVGILGDPDSHVYGTGLEGALECFKTLISELLLIPLGNIELHDEILDITFSDVNLSVLDVLPSEFGFNGHSSFYPRDSTFRSNTSFHLKDCQLAAKAVPFTYASKSEPNAKQSGTIDIKFALDVTIILSPKDKKLLHMFSALPLYEGAKVAISSADVKFYPTGNETSDTVWSTLEKLLISRVRHDVTNWIDGLFLAWLPAKPIVSVVTPSKGLVSALVSPNPPQHPPPPAGLIETHGTARDRFKASIRDMTGLRSETVLSRLPNPLSGPGSPIISPRLDDESMEVKRKRRQSMADHLTDISKADSTLPQNIQRPPVASSRQLIDQILPNVFDDDEDELPSEYETMARSLSVCAERDTTSIATIIRPVVSKKADLISVLSHRGGLPLFPTVEMPYEAYEIAGASMGEPLGMSGQTELMSMAQSLSELTSRDTTTHEAIENPPTTDILPEEKHFLEMSENMSMDKVTRHLSGLPDREENSTTEPSSHQKLVRSGSQHQELAEKVIMADLLTDKIMVDNTLPETQATGDLAGPVAALGVPVRPGLTRLPTQEVVPMGKALNKNATVDTTLPENIAYPPGHHPDVRHPSSGGSFSALKNLHPMSTTLDESIEMDFTTPEGQMKMYRMYENAGAGQAEPVIGFTEQELKQRRQSFKLSDEAMRDTTLLETIRRPPVVPQSATRASDLDKGSELEVLNRERKKSMNAGQFA
ncbi:hypothetical protein CROQUDRAFT_40043 [Cronartium quercuum f. sp. fusiforme G11]|uniref:Uncharacterized protein n=1 Tax=Cronartium quercuum f. sp. fusiforme G11 TaxID=708437 RepID=A0A9P6NLH7_9BASI|nr:hypothetical protein CROQUDRAFT_40043 [Cronartium quercuum f. sp. fusiforme G11]